MIKNSQIEFLVSDFKSKINDKEVSILSDVLIKDSNVRLDFEKFSYGNSIFTGIIHLKNVNEIKKFNYKNYFKNSILNSSDFKTPITNLDIQIESFFEGNIDEIKFKDLNAKSLENELITDLFLDFLALMILILHLSSRVLTHQQLLFILYFQTYLVQLFISF